MKVDERLTLSVSTENRDTLKPPMPILIIRTVCFASALNCVLSTLPYSVFPMGKHQKYDWRKISLYNE